MHHYLIILISSFFLELTVGYPAWLFARIRHPVVWMGKVIALLDKKFNHIDHRDSMLHFLGIFAMILLLIITAFFAWLIDKYANMLLEIVVLASLLATRSLYDHIYDVYFALANGEINVAREKVGRVVGRDVAALDEAGICRAAIESLAESFSDAVVAPLFWAMCCGLPGIACYKAINTADSMIGHKDERYRAFGWAAARLDDTANWIPARFSGLLIAIASFSIRAIHCMFHDARKHASPNAGWPEAAMAGALDIQLGGRNRYDGVEYESALIGKGSTKITLQHLNKSLGIYLNACIILWFTLLLSLIKT